MSTTPVRLLLSAAIMTATLSTTACAERAQVVEYNPNAVQVSPEVGMLTYVNDKFNRMERQLQDMADRMDRLQRDLDQMKALEQRVADLEKKQGTGGGAAASAEAASAPGAVAKTPASNPEEAQAAYKKAFDLLMAGKYDDAAKGFKAFLDKYPDSDQVGNGHYWLGECHFINRKFDLALKSFEQSAVIEGPKQADALLKQGHALVELKQISKARASYEEVRKRFPDTPAAKQAAKALESLKPAEGKS